jgi:hypothetical protein
MKKIILITAVLLLLVAPVFALVIEDHMMTSATKTADGAVMAGSGYLFGIAVVTDGTNAVTVEIYDGTDNTGKQIFPSWVVTTSSTDRIQIVAFDPPLAVDDGVYVDITTAGTVSYNGYYQIQ